MTLKAALSRGNPRSELIMQVQVGDHKMMYTKVKTLAQEISILKPTGNPWSDDFMLTIQYPTLSVCNYYQHADA